MASSDQHISVSGVVIDRNAKKLLIIKRRDIPIWTLPGGGVDEGETPEEAVVREVKEETGVDVAVVRHVAQYLPPNRLAFITNVYECRALSGSPACGEETAEVGFFSYNNLPAPFLPVHQKWINDVLLDEPSLIKKNVEGVAWYNVLSYLLFHPRLSLAYFFFKFKYFLTGYFSRKK